MEELKFVKFYLKRLKINYVQEELEFQYSCHPDFPSLLAISDTLKFLNINNKVFKIDPVQLPYLPSRFVAELFNVEENKKEFYYIEKKNENYLVFLEKDQKNYKLRALKEKFTGLVFLAEQEESNYIKKDKSIIYKFGFLILSVLLGLFLYQKTSLNTTIFFLFPAFGFYLAILALGDFLGVKNKVLDRFCNNTSFASCDAVINSKKWKILKYVSFADLGILFFGFQLFLAIPLFASNDSNHYFIIQSIALLFTGPIILMSIYYQKFIEKKWCPICLLIIMAVFGEFLYVLLTNQFTLVLPSVKTILQVVFILSFLGLLWFWLKQKLSELKMLKEENIVLTRLSRNYKLFKSQLTSNKKRIKRVEDYIPIVLGRKQSNLEISLFTSPLCRFCKDAHKLIENILDRFGDKIRINIFFYITTSIQEPKNLFYHLIDSYFHNGEEYFIKESNKVFQQNLKQTYLSLNDYNSKANKIEHIKKSHELFSSENNLYATPMFFINGYLFPKMYNHDELIYFIPELLEDSSFLNSP